LLVCGIKNFVFYEGKKENSIFLPLIFFYGAGEIEVIIFNVYLTLFPTKLFNIFFSPRYKAIRYCLVGNNFINCFLDLRRIDGVDEQSAITGHLRHIRYKRSDQR